MAVHEVDALPQQDAAQQAEGAKQGGEGDGLGEGHPWRIVHLVGRAGQERCGGAAARGGRQVPSLATRAAGCLVTGRLPSLPITQRFPPGPAPTLRPLVR